MPESGSLRAPESGSLGTPKSDTHRDIRDRQRYNYILYIHRRIDTKMNAFIRAEALKHAGSDIGRCRSCRRNALILMKFNEYYILV